MKSDSLLEEIKSRIDIVEFISDYVQLKRSGQNYKCICPFHSEKTPSFMVSQAKQIFHCFGCGIGGDVVTFLMKYENLSFNEALRYIAKKAGIKIAEFKPQKDASERHEVILNIHKEAMKFFIKNLKGSELALTYLSKRGVDEASIDRFCIGYATDEWDALFKYLNTVGYRDSFIKDAGLVVSVERGYRDMFRSRIIFPIFNQKNDVIAFGGRVIDNSQPKYINSPETELFKKAETLFALNLAKEEIRKTGYAIIVEGYLDAIVCYQYGFKNTVAPLGTALTSRQIQKLKLLTEKAVLVFDNDDAGTSAAKRSLPILCECNFRAKVLLLPEGEDPDSFLRKKGAQHFKRLLPGALSMVEFLLNTLKGDRVDTARETLRMIAGVRDLIIAEELLGELADRTRMNESALRSELKKIKKKIDSHDLAGLSQSMSTPNREEYLLLSAIIAFPEKADTVLSNIDIEDLKDETIKSILGKIKKLDKELNLSSLFDKADDSEKALITSLSLKPGFDLDHVDRNIHDCLQVLMRKRFEEKRRQAEKSGDIALLNALLKEKRSFMKRVSP